MANLQIIRDIAKERQISIRKLANDVGISDVALHTLIKNGSTNTTTLEKIAQILDVSVGVFFEGNTEQLPENITQRQDNNDIADIGLRIRELREVENLTQIEFCDKIGINQANLSHIEKKGVKISVSIISKIISNFNIDANWLLTGQGSMYKTVNEVNTDVFQALYKEQLAENKHLNQQVGELRADNRRLTSDLDDAHQDIGHYKKENARLEREMGSLRAESKSVKNGALPFFQDNGIDELIYEDQTI